MARDGLESLHRRMRVVSAGEEETGLDTLLSAPAQWPVGTVTVAGHGPLHRRVPVLCLVTHGSPCNSVFEQSIEGVIESFERHFDVNLLS